MHEADKLPGLIAEIEGQRVGVLTWNVSEQMLEIVTLNVLKQREGIGKALVEEAIQMARSIKCSRVWVITTNDNSTALKFYKSTGFTIVAVHKDAVAESRKLKPEIPFVGMNGVPITDEIELESLL